MLYPIFRYNWDFTDLDYDGMNLLTQLLLCDIARALLVNIFGPPKQKVIIEQGILGNESMVAKRKEGESVVDYAYRLSREYFNATIKADREKRGQFFTPPSVAHFMASMFSSGNKQIRVADPGAGTGTLATAVAQHLAMLRQIESITLDLYESDLEVLPYLKAVAEETRMELESKSIKFNYRIIEEDFILSNAGTTLTDWEKNTTSSYDLIISNPPYYKIAKESAYSKVFPDVIGGQPNIYPIFMAMATRLLEDGGEAVFITPRSFCSGLYFKKFRKWFLSRNDIRSIHLFESRRAVFVEEEVLQENVIVKTVRTDNPSKQDVHVTSSTDGSFNDMKEFCAKSSDILFYCNDDVFIRVPSNEQDLLLIRSIDSLGWSIRKLGFDISTGPVVDFRTNCLLDKMDDHPNAIPLLWMHNVKAMEITWPSRRNGKAEAIIDCKETKGIILDVKNYVITKRFTSKEQSRRLVAGVLLRERFPYPRVGLDNKLNYIHKPDGELTIEEATGLAALLNTKKVDDYFRTLNGHTQVNATDIRCLPLPSLDAIRAIGRKVIALRNAFAPTDIDLIVRDIMDESKPDWTVKSGE